MIESHFFKTKIHLQGGVCEKETEMKVLQIGPSPTRSKGGMATVIDGISKDESLKQDVVIKVFESYVDGNRIQVLLYSLFAFLKFYFTQRDYDIYHIHIASYGSTFRKGLYVRAAKQWGKKVILHVHGAEYMMFYEKSKRKQRILEILKSADMVIALSSDWKEKFDTVFGLKNCVVLENGVDTRKFAAAVLDPTKHPHDLVMLGRMGQRKGSYDLIQAIEHVRRDIPDIRCYLAGDGEVENCRKLVKEKGLEQNIVILGWIHFEEKLEVLKKTSVLVLPSYNEGLPVSVLEGMACGKIIISTRVGAIPEVVKEENGILIQPGDVKGLEVAIIRACTDVDFRENASKNNRLKAEQSFSTETKHQKLKQYYENV